MFDMFEVIETNEMIDKDLLDVRTITIGISLLDCIDTDLNKLCDNIYRKITRERYSISIFNQLQERQRIW